MIFLKLVVLETFFAFLFEKGFFVFKVGDLVVYGNNGVCKVDSIGPSTLSGADSSKDYYYLIPYYAGNNCRIMIPCDNDRIVLRPLISKAEANALIKDLDKIGFIKVEDEKTREQTYKNAIRGCDCREMFSLIKTIYNRKQTRLAEGKKVTSSDEKYFLIAEDKLYGELAVALGIEKNEVKEYIRSVTEIKI